MFRKPIDFVGLRVRNMSELVRRLDEEGAIKLVEKRGVKILTMTESDRMNLKLQKTLNDQLQAFGHWPSGSQGNLVSAKAVMIVEQSLPEELELDGYLDVTVAEIYSPSKFYINLYEKGTEFENMAAEMT